MKFILAKKIGMSQLFDEKGKVIPLTWLEAGPCFITQVKTEKKDGYKAVQIGFEKGKKKFRYLKEFRLLRSEACVLKPDQKVDVSIFREGDIVKISGVSKGRGFQGVVKRWGFHGAPKSHGTKHALRKPGSIGMTGPERVFKGKKMAGRMGCKKVTVKNLEITKIDKDKNLLAVCGAVPGRRGTLLEIKGM